MKKIVVINGKPLAGKDTVVSISKRLLENSTYNVFNFSSIDPIKHVASLMGWKGKKDEKSRKFLSDLKKLWLQYDDQKILDILRSQIKQAPNYDSLIFVHIREPDEIDRFKEHFESVTTLLVRRNMKSDFHNSSDINVEKYYYDYILENNQGFVNLENSVKTFLKDIIDWRN